jgi:hypothetical protein
LCGEIGGLRGTSVTAASATCILGLISSILGYSGGGSWTGMGLGISIGVEGMGDSEGKEGPGMTSGSLEGSNPGMGTGLMVVTSVGMDAGTSEGGTSSGCTSAFVVGGVGEIGTGGVRSGSGFRLIEGCTSGLEGLI